MITQWLAGNSNGMMINRPPIPTTCLSAGLSKNPGVGLLTYCCILSLHHSPYERLTTLSAITAELLPDVRRASE
jgi:hypothetical protein